MAELPPDAELLPGRYSLEVRLPDQMLDAIASRPRWREAIASYVSRRSTARLRVLGGGVQHNSSSERVFAVGLEVVEPGEVALGTVAVVSVAVIVAAIAAVLGLWIERRYRIKRIESGFDPSDPPAYAGALTVWGVAAGLGALAWLGVQLERGRRAVSS